MHGGNGRADVVATAGPLRSTRSARFASAPIDVTNGSSGSRPYGSAGPAPTTPDAPRGGRLLSAAFDAPRFRRHPRRQPRRRPSPSPSPSPSPFTFPSTFPSLPVPPSPAPVPSPYTSPPYPRSISSLPGRHDANDTKRRAAAGVPNAPGDAAACSSRRAEASSAAVVSAAWSAARTRRRARRARGSTRRRRRRLARRRDGSRARTPPTGGSGARRGVGREGWRRLWVGPGWAARRGEDARRGGGIPGARANVGRLRAGKTPGGRRRARRARRARRRRRRRRPGGRRRGPGRARRDRRICGRSAPAGPGTRGWAEDGGGVSGVENLGTPRGWFEIGRWVGSDGARTSLAPERNAASSPWSTLSLACGIAVGNGRMVSKSGGVRARVGEVSGRPTKVGHPVAGRIGRNPRETAHLRRVLNLTYVRRALHPGLHTRDSRALRPLVDASGSRARAVWSLRRRGGVPVFSDGARRAFLWAYAPVGRCVRREVCVGGREATTVGAAPRASWRLLLAVRGRRGLPNPRRDPRLSPRDAPRVPRRAHHQSSGGPPPFGWRMPRDARRRRPRRVTTARRSDASSASSRSPRCTPPPSPPWAAR